MTRHESGDTLEHIPERAIFIVGAGRFGSRAARLLSHDPDTPVFIMDTDENRLSRLRGLPLKRIPCDGIYFLAKNFNFLNPTNTVVPAIPVHLAFEWLKRYLAEEYQVEKIKLPKGIESFLPHTWPGSEGSLLASYADFICPDDCPEPDCCSVTGERRERPLHDLLSQLEVIGFRNYVIRSHQLAPGLGGYRIAELTKTAQAVTRGKMGKWLLSTSCKCHGILTALEIRSAS
jgi:hypothetical protein